MSDTETFGPRLRSERERRGISLETIATITNVSVELWLGLEQNDFSRWPSGIFARAFVRDYAKAVGLDADEVVDDFCRLFPIGDRRAARVIRAQAELIGHTPEYHDERAAIPGGVDRRAPGPEVERRRAFRMRLAPRAVAAVFDIITVIAAAGGVTLAISVQFWHALGGTALLYYGASTIAAGGSPGTILTSMLRQRVPALFAVQNRRAHA